MFFDNLEFLCKINKTTVSSTAKVLGLSKSSVSSWKNQGIFPNGETIIKLSEHFGVSADFLLFGKKLPNQLTDEEQNWLDLYSQLSESDKLECIGFVKGYIAASTNKNQD